MLLLRCANSWKVHQVQAGAHVHEVCQLLYGNMYTEISKVEKLFPRHSEQNYPNTQMSMHDSFLIRMLLKTHTAHGTESAETWSQCKEQLGSTTH